MGPERFVRLIGSQVVMGRILTNCRRCDACDARWPSSEFGKIIESRRTGPSGLRARRAPDRLRGEPAPGSHGLHLDGDHRIMELAGSDWARDRRAGAGEDAPRRSGYEIVAGAHLFVAGRGAARVGQINTRRNLFEGPLEPFSCRGESRARDSNRLGEPGRGSGAPASWRAPSLVGARGMLAADELLAQ